MVTANNLRETWEINVQASMSEAGEDVIQAEVPAGSTRRDARVEPPRCAQRMHSMAGRVERCGRRHSPWVHIGRRAGDLVPGSQTLYCSGILLGARAAPLLQRLVVDGQRWRGVEDDPRWRRMMEWMLKMARMRMT
jgi:hypothetical protein